MQFDKLLLFSESQAVATAASEHVLDLLDNGDDLSRRLNVLAKIDGGAVAGGTSIQAAFQTSADNAAWETLATYPARTLVQIQADSWIVPPQPLPAGLKRYVRLDYTVTGAFTGAGKILAGITPSNEVRL
jgi:hypothetical protein